jgi:alpha-tubulin suppressor-like RCC1 family protein
MKNKKMLLPALLSIALIFGLIVPASLLNMASFVGQESVTPMVAAGYYHTVGLKSDGTVVAVGNNSDGRCNVGGWADITGVAVGGGLLCSHTVGLKSDGTVVAVGDNYFGQCNVGNWTDITQVAASYLHTVGLKSDGTVVAAGDNGGGKCDVGGWTDIIQVSTGYEHTVGVKSDGTVVAAGDNDDGQCDVGGWTDIVQVAAGCVHTVGLRSDGTVVAAGSNYNGQCDVGGWTDITQVTAGWGHTVGLKKDGTVVAVGYNDDGQCDVGNWTDIVQVAAGWRHTVGLRSDGTVVAVGYDYYGQCNVGGWNLVLALPPSQCVLTISSTGEGSVTTPGEGTFTYDKGTVVNLVAKAEENYEFVEWTGDVDTIADVYDATTTISMNSSYSITANFELEQGLCSLTISSSTEGGSVTTPGEGTFIYDTDAVVDLVAQPDEGCQFVKWTGNVSTIADVYAVATTITMKDSYSITADFGAGIKAGDWIKIKYTTIGWPEPYPDWMKLEFLSVEGTSANARVTLHMSDETEQSDTVPVDVAAGGGEAPGLSGFVIPANLTTGDSVYMTGYGNVTIAGETTRTYAGARRTVVYTSLSQDGVQLTYYWDKLTGVMVEGSTTYAGTTATAKATETNMWEATTVGMPWWVWVVIAVAIGAAAFALYRLKKKTPNTPSSPTEGT